MSLRDTLGFPCFKLTPYKPMLGSSAFFPGLVCLLIIRPVRLFWRYSISVKEMLTPEQVPLGSSMALKHFFSVDQEK